MTDIDIIDQEDLFSDDGARGEQWLKSICSGSLRRIATRTRSDFAILRLVEFDTGRHRLGCYAVGDQSDAEAKIRSRWMRIPQTKTIACWNGIDPLTSWGYVKHTATENEENAADWMQWKEIEKNFVRWVKEKAWFPLMLGERGTGFVVLVRGEVKGFNSYEIVRAWLHMQVAVSKALRGPQHSGLVSSTSHVTNALASPDFVTMLQVLCRCLASAHGLGWHRVWFFKQSAGRFSCQAAIGEVSNERWSTVLRSLSATSLAEEMTAVVAHKTYRTDSLFQACCAPEDPLTLDFAEDDLELIFSHLDESVSGRVIPLAVRLDGGILGGARSFHDRVNAHVRSSGFSYEADKHSYVLPLRIGDTRFLVFLGHAYQGEQRSLALATMFLNHAAYVAKEWLTAPASSSPGHQGSSMIGETARKVAMLARVRDAALDYEQDDETRQKVASMAEEVLRRAKQPCVAKKKK